ncbi:anti-sigma factor, partial [Demequina sp.]|uniref:anti-sigma factor n=1 Tax=Demequina sp. TaxID=2050685 RepID=UPI0025E0AB1F
GGGAPDELAARRRRPSPWLVGMAAAAAGVVLGAAGVGLLTSGGDSPQTLVASAQLADLATEAEAGEARVERRDDGSEVLVVDTTFTDAGAANLEVWLIDTEVQGMVSLGYLTQDHEEFEIPAGYDVAAFPIVDISVEPADGVPTHSGDSITRGILS